MSVSKEQRKVRRTHKTRTRIIGKQELPRLSVYRSHKTIAAQIIDDAKGVTIASVHSKDAKAKGRMEVAAELGEKLAAVAKEKKVTAVRFDRGGYKYHGIVKALAEGARKGGLEF